MPSHTQFLTVPRVCQIGGATALIGDPSGRLTERPMLGATYSPRAEWVRHYAQHVIRGLSGSGIMHSM